jgi:hypothetical protein
MQMQGDMEVEGDKQVVNNNTIFVGSTDDLLEMMKNKQGSRDTQEKEISHSK